MQVLLDECLPRKLKFELAGVTVQTVPEMGWAGTKNGALLRLAETKFDVFITADQNVEYQQRLKSNHLGIIVLVAPNNRFATLQPLMVHVQQTLASIQAGDLLHIRV